MHLIFTSTNRLSGAPDPRKSGPNGILSPVFLRPPCLNASCPSGSFRHGPVHYFGARFDRHHRGYCHNWGGTLRIVAGGTPARQQAKRANLRVADAFLVTPHAARHAPEVRGIRVESL